MANHGARSGSYVVVDFDNVTEQGLKSLTTALNRAGSPVKEIEATNRKSRKDGLSVKKAKLFFENGQTATLFIGDQGDIYQLVVNGKRYPLPQANNETQFAKELHKILERTQADFDKSQLKKASAAVPKNTSQTQPASRSLAKRAEEARSHITAMEANHSEMKATLDRLNAEKSVAQDKERQLAATLETEKQETTSLKEKLNELQESGE